MLMRLAKGIASVPARCAVCARWPAQPVCESCVARFAQPAQRCRRCALPVPGGVAECGRCLREPGPLDACHAAVSYGYPWQSLIGQFKFQGGAGWASAFATLLRSAPWVEPALDAADLVLAMPLSTARLAARGFNQSLLIARRLAHGRVEPALLLRLRDTPPQSALAREARMANVRDAFAVDPLRTGAVKGRRVVVVDDVMTSGASLGAAAMALRRAGAAHVTGIVFARTGDDA